jgi:hypothetical protein
VFSTHPAGVVNIGPGHTFAMLSIDRFCHHVSSPEFEKGKSLRVAHPLVFIVFCFFVFATLSFQRVWGSLIGSSILFHFSLWAGRTVIEHSSLSFTRFPSSLSAQKCRRIITLILMGNKMFHVYDTSVATYPWFHLFMSYLCRCLAQPFLRLRPRPRPSSPQASSSSLSATWGCKRIITVTTRYEHSFQHEKHNDLGNAVVQSLKGDDHAEAYHRVSHLFY